MTGVSWGLAPLAWSPADSNCYSPCPANSDCAANNRDAPADSSPRCPCTPAPDRSPASAAPEAPDPSGPGCTTGGASDAGLVTTAGGSGGGGGRRSTSFVSWKTVPGITGCTRVAPTRNSGRVASSREARNGGEGSASANTATPSGSLGRSSKPAGIDHALRPTESSRRSC